MPKSRNRKGHAKKAQARKNDLVHRRKTIDNLVKELEYNLANFSAEGPAPEPSNYNVNYGN
jgi:hypothetical protein